MSPRDVGIASEDRSFIGLHNAECGTLGADSGRTAQLAGDVTR